MSENLGATTAKKPLWKRWWFIGLIALLIIGGLARMGKKTTPADPSSTPTSVEKGSAPQTDSTADKAPEPAKKQKGLGVGRSKFASVLESDEVGFAFREGKEIDGMPNWIGTSEKLKGGIVQMLGNPSDLNKISATAIARSGTQDNALSVMMVVAVANITNEQIGDWVKGEIKKQTFQESFTERESFPDAYVKMTYEKETLPMLILEIEAR